MELIQNFINGQHISSDSSESLDIYEPATGDIYGQLRDSNANDIDHAVRSAKTAFALWSDLTVGERAVHLNNIAKGIEKRLDEFAEIESRDTGKPIALSRSLDIPRSVLNFKFFAEHGENFEFNYNLNNETSQNHINRSPLGVVACISPWNLPLYLFTWKIAPALITGNTVIAKPSELAPYTAYMLGKVCQEAGLPPGVLNIVNGMGSTCGELLVKHKEIKAISFTGGTSTGKLISQSASKTFKKLSLEMGGKNPAIIFEDCNYELMLENILRSSFSNQGQICLCSSRLLIERTIYEKFKNDLSLKVSELLIGDPSKTETQFGSISSKGHFDKVVSYIDMVKEEGGKIIAGGKSVKLEGRCSNGWFIEPTLVEGLSPSSRLNQEEIFGPVVTLQSFETESEAIDLANNTDYGLSATVWTKDLEKGQRVSKKIDAGVIWINCWLLRDLRTPFGGMKNSGLGREGGDDAIKFFTEQKNICIPV